jgi:hypothetical protein
MLCLVLLPLIFLMRTSHAGPGPIAAD